MVLLRLTNLSLMLQIWQPIRGLHVVTEQSSADITCRHITPYGNVAKPKLHRVSG